MTDLIRLRVYGEPQPQGSKTPFVNRKTGKVALVEGRRPQARENFRSWRDAVAQAARDWRVENDGLPLDEPVDLRAIFYLSKPRSLPRWRWLPWTRPDVDKLTRALLDSLTSVLIADDARVTDLHVLKRYSLNEAPGVLVELTPLGQFERLEAVGSVPEEAS